VKRRKIPNETIIAAYRETGSAYKVAVRFGISSTAIYNRMKRQGVAAFTYKDPCGAVLENAVIPEHPAIIRESLSLMKIYGSIGPSVQVVCLHCKKPRWSALRMLKHQVFRPGWSGACKPCLRKLSKGGWTFRRKKNPDGRRINDQGYVLLSKGGISAEDMPLFLTVAGSPYTVLEHRWVMSKHLGRAIQPNELIDHMNGIRDDNKIENLRIYLFGKQQPGSSRGYGTYYHEWQMAERRIELLEARLKELGG
jgi:hypothetical protein